MTPFGYSARLSALGLALALVPTACEPEPQTANIAYAMATLADAVLVARDEIAEWPTGGIQISILHDSIAVPGASVAEQEALRAERLVNGPPLAGVVGPGSSRGALAASPIYNQARLPQLVPTATSRLMGELGGWTFTLAPNDSIMGAFLGDFIANTLDARLVTVFYLSAEYGYGLRDGVVAFLAKNGVNVIDAVPYDLESDFDVLVAASLSRGVPEAIVIAGRAPGAIEIIGRVQYTHPEISFVAGDGLARTSALLRVGPGLERLYAADFWNPSAADSVSQAFAARYRRIIGREPTGSSAIRHDALMILASAVREAGTSPRAIRSLLNDPVRLRQVYRTVSGTPAFGQGPARKLYIVRPADNTAVSNPGGRP